MIYKLPREFVLYSEFDSVENKNDILRPYNENNYKTGRKTGEQIQDFLEQYVKIRKSIQEININTEEEQEIIEQQWLLKQEREFRKNQKELNLLTIHNAFKKTIENQKEKINAVISEEQRRLQQEKQIILEELEKKEKKKLEKQKKEEEQKRYEEKKKQEEEKKLALEEQERQRKKNYFDGFTNFEKINNEFLSYKLNIKKIKSDVKEVINQDKEKKKIAFSLKRKINPNFGQLTDSFKQLERVQQEIKRYIEESRNDELIYRWTLNFVSKALIQQAEVEVTVKISAVLPLARLAYFLINNFPEMENYLTSRFVKKCPMIIGFNCLIDTEEGRLNMGWKRKESLWEDDVKYDERVSGIFSLWSTMTRLVEFKQVEFFSFKSSWKFIARLLNTDVEKLRNIHLAILGSWWETTAEYFLKIYQRQGRKLIEVMIKDWLILFTKRDFPSATRLSLMTDDWMKTQNFNSIEEMKP